MPIPDGRLIKAMETYIRIGRWGTCSDCPVSDKKYPEFCKYTDRYDHQLDGKAIAESLTTLENNAKYCKDCKRKVRAEKKFNGGNPVLCCSRCYVIISYEDGKKYY